MEILCTARCRPHIPHAVLSLSRFLNVQRGHSHSLLRFVAATGAALVERPPLAFSPRPIFEVCIHRRLTEDMLQKVHMYYIQIACSTG